MFGWLSLLCLLAQAQATTAPSAAAASSAPTLAPTNGRDFPLPRLPISKAGALYPDCRAEIIFVVDVSSSVVPLDQQTLMRFTVQFMIAVEKNVGFARFGVVIFGINNGVQYSKHFNASQFGGPMTNVAGPFGNQKSPSASELVLRLNSLKYGCPECLLINRTWSQLEMMYTLSLDGYSTPTWDGLEIAKEEYDTHGDPTVPGRFIVLITDGIPNDGDCNIIGTPACVRPVALTDEAVNVTKNGTLLLTVGMNLRNDTQPLMIQWASNPKNLLAIPSTSYSELATLIPRLLGVLCPAGKGIDCLAADATKVDINGQGFLDTHTIFCRYFRDQDQPSPDRTTAGIYVNSTLITCPLPDSDNFFPGEWNLNYTQDGRGYYAGARFKYGTLCRPELLVIWWPFCALALLPLAFCRPKKVAPVTTQKVSRGVARAAPAATEEYEEYEEVEEIVAPPEPVNKWKVAPTAYIGFGRARMSVDWAGVAPESAPHEGVRKKVVKKVVSDHAPVPTAGPVGTPMPAQEAEQTETVTQSRPQVVEEPDWVNSFMDRIAAIICCCCVKKK